MQQNTPYIYDDIAVIIDTDLGSCRGYGKPESVKQKFDRLCAADPECAENIHHIVFNIKTGCSSYDQYTNARLTKDEICTFVNYSVHCSGSETLTEILTYDETRLHAKLASLAEIGY